MPYDVLCMGNIGQLDSDDISTTFTDKIVAAYKLKKVTSFYFIFKIQKKNKFVC